MVVTEATVQIRAGSKGEGKHVRDELNELQRIEDEREREKRVAEAKGDIIQLPGFTSILPQLPEEPEVKFAKTRKSKKHKGLLDDDSVELKPKAM